MTIQRPIGSAKQYNYFRDYDPAIGRYSESDPLGIKAGTNTFGYVTGNPIRFSDRRGLATDCPSGPADGPCCNHPASKFGLAGIGGTVMCCGGRKVSCSNVSGPEPGNSLLRKCVIEHEDRHFPDAVCLDNFSIHRAVFQDGVSQRDGECAAYKVELQCLARSGPQCGGDGVCLEWVRRTYDRKLSYGNLFFNCGFVR